MKTIIVFLFILLTTNLFAQTKHSDLYYQVETLCKTILKSEMSTFNKKAYDQRISQISDSLNNVNPNRIVFSSMNRQFYIDTISPVLVINNILYRDFSILDSMSADSIYAIEVLKEMPYDKLYFALSTKGFIHLKTQRYYLDELFPESKKKKKKI